MRRRYNPYKKGSSLSKRSYGNLKSAKTQSDSANFVVKGTRVFNAFHNPEQWWKKSDGSLVFDTPAPSEQPGYTEVNNVGSAVINFYEVLNGNKNFNNMKSMYDEFRINKITARITVANATGVDLHNLQELQLINIVTAWDRTGISSNQVTALTEDVSTPNNTASIINPKVGNQKRSIEAKCFFTKLGPVVGEYSSSFKSQLNAYQNWRRNCSLSAKSADEKSCYISTEVIDAPGYEKNANNGKYLLPVKMSLEDLENDVNPSSIFENPVLKWKPTLLLSVYTAGINAGELVQYSKTANIIFNMEYAIDCTFRGMKGTS